MPYTGALAARTHHGDTPSHVTDLIDEIQPNDIIDWSVEQEDTTIHPANYTNTTYELASNGTAGLSKYNFNLNRKTN